MNIEISFDHDLLDAIQTSENFVCLFSCSNDSRRAEIHQSGNGTFYLFNWAAGDDDDMDIAITDENDVAVKFASDAIAHQSCNWDYESYEGEGEEPEKTDESFSIGINKILELMR